MLGLPSRRVAGSIDAARDCRAAWVDAKRKDREPDVPDPKDAPIETFEGGTIALGFRPTRDRDHYEIATMYPQPPDREEGSR